jgi:hypothetical protein
VWPSSVGRRAWFLPPLVNSSLQLVQQMVRSLLFVAQFGVIRNAQPNSRAQCQCRAPHTLPYGLCRMLDTKTDVAMRDQNRHICAALKAKFWSHT